MGSARREWVTPLPMREVRKITGGAWPNSQTRSWAWPGECRCWSPTEEKHDAFRDGIARSSLDAEAYVAQFRNGHHSPRGNCFFAWAIKQDMVAWLNPKPPPYRP